MSISEYTVRSPITTIMVCLSLVVLGAISLTRVPLEYAPSLSWPSMYVEVDYPSSSPEEVERNISRPMEEVLATLPNVEAISSWSRDSGSRLRMEFAHGTDMDLMFIQVRDRLDQVRQILPDDVEHMEIRRWDTDDWPILDYSLAWRGDNVDELGEVCEQVIVPRLQRLQGVGGVSVEGLQQRQLLVEMDQSLLNAHRVRINDLNRTIRSNNVNVSAGDVTEGDKRYAVRVIGEFETVDQIRRLPLSETAVLDDVADVTYGYPESESFERLDGRDAIEIEIRKTTTGNLVSTANRVRAEVERILDDVGRDKLQMELIRDQSEAVTTGISNLVQSAIIGGLLAVAMIFLFLRSFRSTVIIATAIPISAMCVFVMMYLLRQGFDSPITLNLISMMGLMVAIGMLVDPAVVTLENIYRKRFDEGLPPAQAAVEGAREIGMPVLAAGLTTICVFVPLVFLTDSSTAMWMRDFAVTVVISVVASVCIALTLIPMLGARAYPDHDTSRVDRWLKATLAVGAIAGLSAVIYATGVEASWLWLSEGVLALVTGLGGVSTGFWIVLVVFAVLGALSYRTIRSVGIRTTYARIVAMTLRFRWTTVTFACVVLGLGLFVFQKVEKQRYRWQPTRQIEFEAEMPRSYDVEDASRLFTQIEQMLIPMKDELNIRRILTRYRSPRRNEIRLYLTSAEEATLTTEEVRKRVQALFPTDIPGVTFRRERRGGGDGAVEVEIFGRNSDVLGVLAEEMAERFRGMDGVNGVETSLEDGTEEIRVSVNREVAQRHGLSPTIIARTVATALGTRGSSKFKTGDGEIDIRLILQEEDRKTLEELKNATFATDSGEEVAFGSLATFEFRRGPRTIERQDRMSTIELEVSTDRSQMYQIGLAMQRDLKAFSFPSGYGFEMGRNFRSIAEEQGETNFTMLFAIVLIYLIMASLFESYIHPFTIMFSIGFAFIGVAFGLYAFQVPLDSNAQYGLLILFGIVVNNGIVLVDHINRYRLQGLPRAKAIQLGGQDRLRPIAMTAATTILGLAPLVVPMIYGTAEGYARRWGPIGLVVVCGLAAATVLTLVLLPTIYSLMDDVGQRTRRVVASAWKHPVRSVVPDPNFADD